MNCMPSGRRVTDRSHLHNLIRDDAMFQGDVEIQGENKTGFSRDHIDSEYGRIDKNNQPGYFTDRYK